MIRCGELIQPLCNLLHEQLLQRSVIHMDDNNAGSIVVHRTMAAKR